MEQIFLSRRNLLTLLSKLDRQKAGDSSACSLIKYDNQHPIYAQTMEAVVVTAVEDDVYYAHRQAGDVAPADDPK